MSEIFFDFFYQVDKLLYICAKQGVRALHQSLIESVNLDKVTTLIVVTFFYTL
jgi:hypothetical protein